MAKWLVRITWDCKVGVGGELLCPDKWLVLEGDGPPTSISGYCGNSQTFAACEDSACSPGGRVIETEPYDRGRARELGLEQRVDTTDSLAWNEGRHEPARCDDCVYWRWEATSVYGIGQGHCMLRHTSRDGADNACDDSR